MIKAIEFSTQIEQKIYLYTQINFSNLFLMPNHKASTITVSYGTIQDFFIRNWTFHLLII